MTRAGLRPISRQTRAYFAAVDRVTGPTTIFDPSQNAGFQLTPRRRRGLIWDG